MFRTLSTKLNRKKSDAVSSSYYSEAILSRGAKPAARDVAQKSVTRVSPEGPTAPKTATVSTANYRANDPQTDSHVLKADNKHLFAAVLCAKPSARGSHYLRQHLHNELLAQLKKLDGDAPKAILETLRSLDTAFRNLHPFNNAVMEGVRLGIAYADFQQGMLYLASNGGCRCVVGSSSGEQKVLQIGGQEIEGEAPQELGPSNITAVPLSQDVDTIVLGSAGFWHEVAPHKAVLRLRHYHEMAPSANEGSAAAHLTNFALHCVTRRMRGHSDLRMRSLRSVSNLLSLPPGDVSQFKWAGRQPVRRRRGDVHGDLTAVVLRLDWRGTSSTPQTEQPRPLQSQRPSSRSRWDLVRLHFLDYKQEAGALTRQQWAKLVDQALAAKRSGQLTTELAVKPKAMAYTGQANCPPSFDVSARAIAAEAG